MTDFDGIEIHTKLEVNKPQSFLAGQEEADTELTGPKVRQFIAQHKSNGVAAGAWWITTCLVSQGLQIQSTASQLCRMGLYAVAP